MVFPLPTGRQWCTVLWRRKSRSAQLQQSMVSLMKRSVASFVLLRKSIHSKKRNCTICHDGCSHRVFLLCSRTDPLHNQHHGYQRHYLFSSTKGHPNYCPPLQGGWSGRTPGVALWRHGTRPRCHTVSIAGEDRTHLDKRRITWGTDGKAVVIETTMPFLQAARPW